jgi:hypothetical protein
MKEIMQQIFGKSNDGMIHCRLCLLLSILPGEILLESFPLPFTLVELTSHVLHLFLSCVIAITRRLGTKNSNGIIASFPYTNLNGVCSVNLLHVVLYAHNTAGIFKSQSSLLTL